MELIPDAPTPDLVEQYRREMLEMYRKQPSAPEENWLDARFPEPNIEQDQAAMTVPDPPVEPDAPGEPEAPNEPDAPPIAPTPFIGYLRVFTVTGSEAEPVSGAQVTVTREEVVYATAVTDRDGYTPVIPLPTVDPALSLQPGNTTPYVAYTVSVSADGFRPARHNNMPVYGNNYVTQPVALLPLQPGEDPEDTQDFTSGGPVNL